MIALRHTLERARRRRWLGLVFVVLLVLLLVLVVLHGSRDMAETGAATTCLLIAISFIVVTFIQRQVCGGTTLPPAARGPPRPRVAFRHRGSVRRSFSPLRL